MYRLLAWIVAVVASFAALTVVVSHSDAAKRLPFVTGGGAYRDWLTSGGKISYQELFVVGTIKRPAGARFRILILGGPAADKATCVYGPITNYRVEGVKATFDARAGCRGRKGKSEVTFQRKNRFTVADGGNWSEDRISAKALPVDNRLASPLELDKAAFRVGTFSVNEGGSTPRVAQATKAPYVVGGAWRYGPRAGSTYYIFAELQGATRHVEVVEDLPNGYTHCTYDDAVDFAVTGSQANGYRATFEARGTCARYVFRGDRYDGLQTTPRRASDRFTIVDHPGGIGERDTLEFVQLEKDPEGRGFNLPARVIEAGNFTIRPG